jgi:hypothetical protein
MRLGGWQRLWVVLTTLWTITVGLVTWNTWPPMYLSELSARTFCTFPREFSSLRRQGRPWESAAHPGHGSARLLGAARSASPGQSRPDVRGRGARWSEGGQFSGDQAAASIDGLPISGLA